MAYNFKTAKGDLVSVHYTGTFEDGTIFDSSHERGQPLIFEVGAPGLIPEFSKAPIGMFPGQKKKITLTPENAYGAHNPEMLREVALNLFTEDETPEPGTVVSFISTQEDREIPGTVMEIKDDIVMVDFNHPMAGKTLNFEIELIKRGATVGQDITNENETRQD